MSEIDSEPFPRGALIGAAALVALSVAVTAVVRLERIKAPPAPPAEAGRIPTRMIDLQFADSPDGGVSIRNSATGQEVSHLAPNSNGFVRGVMRGLVRERKMRHIGSAPPFRLAQWPDRHMTLRDTATGVEIDLDAFGDINRDAFSVLLPRTGASS
jgi:putative photosynthetic complex assembly protein